jgi:nucleoid-associated protein YgaU
MTHWIHPPQRGQASTAEPFDPVVEGAKHGLPGELAIAIWQRVCADATDVTRRCDVTEAQRRFHELAARMATRGLRRDVGRITRVGVELNGDWPRATAADELAIRAPGRDILVAAEARRWAQRFGEQALPGADDVGQALAALRHVAHDTAQSVATRAQSHTTPPAAAPAVLRLLWSTRATGGGLERLFGARGARPDDDQELRDQQTRALRDDLAGALGLSGAHVEVQVDETARHKAAANGARGLMEDGRVYLHPDHYDPATTSGRALLAHEMIHVAQAALPRSRAPTTALAAEAEASHLAEQYAHGRRPARPAVALPGRAAADNGKDQDLRGKPVRKRGITYKEEGAKLRDKPSSGPASRVKKLLPLNTRLFVDSEDNDHYLVTTNSGDFGYVAKSHIKTRPPEPNATIHHVKAGDTALKISRKHYGGQATWGADHRFFVNGLVRANQGKGRRGIYKSDNDADWDTTKVRAGYAIWVPSAAFMHSLHGKVGSGSITQATWETTKRAASAVADFAIGAGAFIGGLLHGIAESVWDILVGLKDLAVMVWDILKSLFTGNLLKDAQGLWNDFANLDVGKLAQSWIDKLDAKWNHADLLTRWHFRGWLIGYLIAEVVMLVFSGGVIQGIKWLSKTGKLAKIAQSMPRIAKFAKAAKESKVAKKLLPILGGKRKPGGAPAKAKKPDIVRAELKGKKQSKALSEMTPEARAKMEDAFKRRGEMIKQRDRLEARKKAGTLSKKDAKELSKLKGAINEQSRHLGELAAHDVMKAKGGKLSYPKTGKPSTKGDFDLIYKVGDEIYVVEAKGGSGALGTRKVGGATVQQGTSEYLRDIIRTMADSPNAEAREVAAALQTAQRTGKVKYVMVEAPIGTKAGAAVLGDVKISEFVLK